MDPDAEHGFAAFDLNVPSAARAYDYMLGGAHNFESDRALAEQVIAVAPWVTNLARMNRSFLHRVVDFYLDQGVTQFLDLGSGIPTVASVHGAAQQRVPDARVVYVDHDPIVFTQVNAMVADNPHATVLHADVRDPRSILEHPATRELLDFTQPIGVLMLGVMFFIEPECAPAQLVATYRDRVAPGSFLAISQITDGTADAKQLEELGMLVAGYKSAHEPVFVRTRAELDSWFATMTLVEPGTTSPADWHPISTHEFDDPARSLIWCGVARKDA